MIATVAALALALVQSAQADTLHVRGLRQPVEVRRDQWGIAHIDARSEHDLFFAQGYLAARERAFQFELWRRQATGTLAEVLGKRELARDRGARLFRYRGSMRKELLHYHPRGAAIIGAFVDGVNAYVDQAARDSTLVPLELRMLGMKPGRWTPDVVISRHQGLLGNIEDELRYGRFVAHHSAALLRKIEWFHPGPEPALDLDPMLAGNALDAPILAPYEAFRTTVRFQPSDVLLAYRGDSTVARRVALLDSVALEDARWQQRRDIGSNNWVVNGTHTASGRAAMANDPHRTVVAPSLRYFVHLRAPGWNVIGGGEPMIPGVSIGHNEVGAWGLTVFETDGEDLLVYRTNPANLEQYEYRGGWETMRTIRERVPIRGEAPAEVTLKYTRHGPVVYEDSARHLVYAVRAAWLEPGGAPYLASLRMDQARSWEEFRAACAYSNIPGENMVWADVHGNIGWQAVGIAPIRPRSSGLVPVPGDGRFDWAGYLPILEKPHAFNPREGFTATANNNLTPPSYAHRDAIGWSWADPYRWQRIAEVLDTAHKLTVADMARLQTDYASLPARALVPLLAPLASNDTTTERARRTLLAWDRVLDAGSIGAGIYEAWYRALARGATDVVVPLQAREEARGIPTHRIVEWLTLAGTPAPMSRSTRDSLLLASLSAGVRELMSHFGADTLSWTWGHYHQALLKHPLSAALDDVHRAALEAGPWPRGGDGNTVGATGSGPLQLAGASFRMVVEAGDWDGALGTNTPGQSGDPRSTHYRDLFELWKQDRFFPVKFSREGVAAVTERVIVLMR